MELKWPLSVQTERRDGVVVLVLAGRLGTSSAVALQAAVVEAVGPGNSRLVLDLAGVDYISSAGLHALSAAADRCTKAGGGLTLCGVTDPVRIALDLGGLLENLPVESSRHSAVMRAAGLGS
jgi:anti-anti-sigma factor